jgi:hypothetical protein
MPQMRRTHFTKKRTSWTSGSIPAYPHAAVWNTAHHDGPRPVSGGRGSYRGWCSPRCDETWRGAGRPLQVCLQHTAGSWTGRAARCPRALASARPRRLLGPERRGHHAPVVASTITTRTSAFPRHHQAAGEVLPKSAYGALYPRNLALVRPRQCSEGSCWSSTAGAARLDMLWPSAAALSTN